ncbi:P-loop containing nucleoside triphosphate hydrolase protein [Choiromyces venosus 120613-1]|uniref:P-loop containing nucleoside triphosphate hydrolase protein n=1 Tax=Choiromyces venosus 120613-1 TaxID=1336337 RepID=A0A3N4K3I6_9PEZI|nr:P-loop containing nucleoside triphosphate hydrolase protein [Choiromyces venosus 120613-1]
MDPKIRRKRKSKAKQNTAKKPRKEPTKETTPASIPIPWPPHFKNLQRLYEALNLIYTFCAQRKHVVTTFDMLKSAVEGQVKKELTVGDVAQMKFLVPRSLRFTYVDEELLQVHVMGQAKDIYEEGKETPRMILFLEFLDGEVNQRSGKTPAVSQKAVLALIKKRNEELVAAVNKFLKGCAEKGVDAVEHLKGGYREHIPRLPGHPQSNSQELVSAKGNIEIPKERKPIAEIIEEIKSLDLYRGQIVPNGRRVIPPQDAVFGDLKFLLSQALVNAIYTAHNVTRLYAHQVEAINNLYDGHNVIVSTSTSSGKSLIYQIPVLHRMEKSVRARTMAIFPTKALAQDQKRSLIEVLGYMTGVLGEVLVDTYDGDTKLEDRDRIRQEARVIFTNPDMLHCSILPNKGRWKMFLQNLKYVIVDELHVYNGLFGSHVAFIMRRLRRVCALFGNTKVQFVSCSATVANPENHMRTIFGIDSVKLTDVDGSPAGRKEFLCWNSPYKDSENLSLGRVDPVLESARLFAQLILRGIRAIAFCRVRNVCELLIKEVKSEFARLDWSEVAPRVMAYRGGYTPQDRRQIEKEMFEGHLLGIVATSALELGVDIGSLDAVIMVGFPHSISSLRQQSGRAGRRNKDSLSILVAGSTPRDQFYMDNPDEIFTKPNSELQIDLENPVIREGHLQCAAYEVPINPLEDSQYFGPDLQDLVESKLTQQNAGSYYPHESFLPYPSKHVSIREGPDPESHISVINTTNSANQIIETLDPEHATFTLYEGGIFLSQGKTYIVKNVNLSSKFAAVESLTVDWTTTPQDYTDIDPIETAAVHMIPESPSKAFYGTIRIHTIIYGFLKTDRAKRVLDAVEIDSPPITKLAKGMWLDVPPPALEILVLKNIDAAAAVHAAEHAVLNLFGNFVSSVSGAVKTECKSAVKSEEIKGKGKPMLKKSRTRPARLVFYDAGATGMYTLRAFESVHVLLRQAVERMEGCACLDGCFECIRSEYCQERNALMSKPGAYVILRKILGLEVDLEKVPDGAGDGRRAVSGDKVVLAEEVGMGTVAR